MPPDTPHSPVDIVLCCDGTNNTLTGGIEDTNVLLLYGYLLKHTDPARTRLYYDPGVGVPDAAPPTDLVDMVKRRVERLSGLASGRGVYENIEQAYRFLMHHWRGPDDRIFCFGFSRGAFTARAVVGMVNLFGVIRPQHDSLLPTLIRIYFSQPAHADQSHGRKSWQRGLTSWLHQGFAKADKAGSEAARPSHADVTQGSRKLLAEQVRRSFGIDDPQRQATVYWVGVWDTVESVGLPVLFNRDNPATATFHDKPGIKNVRHALALDEHRWPFVPRLYDASSEERHDDAQVGQRTLKQLWFPGVHCDVGGSYQQRQSGLPDAALMWMVNEVKDELGLPRLDALPRAGQPLPFDELGMQRDNRFPSANPLRHDALWDTPLWVLAGMTVRDLGSHRVASNLKVEEAVKHGQSVDTVGVLVDAKAAAVPALPHGPSVWDARRAPWPVVLALVCVLLGLVLSGRCLTGRDGEVAALPAWPVPTQTFSAWTPWRHAPAAAFNFANQQLATLAGSLPARWPQARHGDTPPRGLHDRDTWDLYMARSPAWALLWDLFTIAGLAYLLSRLASRGFAYLAGYRQPGQKAPAWRTIGWLPLLAIAADVGENASTALALLLHALGSPLLSGMALSVMALLAWAKVLGYLACVLVYGPLRLWIAVSPKQTVGKVGRRSSPASTG